MSENLSQPQQPRLRSEGLAWREVDGELIVLDNRSAQYLSVNGSGALLWQSLVEGASATQLSDQLVQTYQLEPARAAVEVEAFLAMLSEHGLLAP